MNSDAIPASLKLEENSNKGVLGFSISDAKEDGGLLGLRFERRSFVRFAAELNKKRDSGESRFEQMV